MGGDFSEANWEVVYFLATYGAVFYLATVVSFPILHIFMKEPSSWTPLKLKQKGLTQLGATAGGFWFLYNLLMKQLPTDTQDDILPPNSFTCWVREFWKTAAISVFANSILVKQYKYYIRYVSRDQGLPTYVYMLLSSIPYLLMVSLPVWDRYDSSKSVCTDPNAAQAVLFSWTCLVFISSAVLLNTLRDTVTYFPNLQGSIAEVGGLLVVILVKGFELWAPCATGFCPSTFTKTTVTSFTLITVPNAVYWLVLGQVMWKIFSRDEEYCRGLERLCSPTTHLIGAQSEDEDEEDPNLDSAEGDAVFSFTAAPRMRPNYDKGSTGEFFETDRLARLIDNGDCDAVRSFVLETNLDLVHILDRDGLAPLHRAVQGGFVDLVSFLLEINCDPNLPSRDGDRAIHFAARTEHIQIISTLLGANADVNAVSHRGITPIHYAILAGSIPTIDLLLDEGALLNIPGSEVLDKEGWERVHVADAGRMRNYWKQPLMLAVEMGLADITSSLMRCSGPLINTPCAHGLTLLMTTVVLGNEEVADVLLQNDADIWRINHRDKRNVLHYNAMQGSTSMFQLIKGWYLKTEPPKAPPESPKKEKIPSTPKRAVRVNTPTSEPMSPGVPLGESEFDSCCEGNGDVMLDDSMESTEIVIKPRDSWYGPADPKQLLAVFLSMPDCMGRTPLHYAVLKANSGLVTMLLSEGANPKVRDLPRPERGCLGATPSEYVQQLQLHGTPGERAKFYQVLVALRSGGAIGDK